MRATSSGETRQPGPDLDRLFVGEAGVEQSADA
jgi:hypothetical protein